MRALRWAWIPANEESAPMAIKRIKILGAVLELSAEYPLNTLAKPAHSPQKLGKLVSLAWLFSL